MADVIKAGVIAGVSYTVTCGENILCLGNPAWKGRLALLFVGGAASLFYKYDKYEEKPYIQVGIGMGIIGLALFIWFGITG